jgi:5-methyltetrahydrofolate--homocysteine methyltransferase
MRTTLQELLANGNIIVADGAMGSRLMAAGMPTGASSELWNVENPAAVRDVHRSYIEAGSRIILSNSFTGSRPSLARHDLAERTAELNQAAAENARAEADAANHPVLVGGSIGPSGEIFEPFGPLNEAKAVDLFAEQAAALAAGGVDVFWIETMFDLQEVTAAVAGCRIADPDIPVVTTMSFDRKGRTMMGVTPEQALESQKALGVVALGGNCGNGPDEILAVIEKMHAHDPDVVLVAKANAGMPKLVGGQTVYDADPQEMARYAQQARDSGARIIGACCGSTAEHIKAIAEAVS